jgi:hypothetical protein
MFASLLILPIVKLEQHELIGALHFSFLNSNPDHCCWLAGSFDLEVLSLLFENKESKANGETTVLRTAHIPASKSSSNFLVRENCK